jgi:O-antigen/teichoic acid export membrane protein
MQPSSGVLEDMTAEVIPADPKPVVDVRPELSGAWLLSAGMLVSGALTYAFHLLVARTLGPADFGRIAVLWAAVFLAATAIFRPLEQTTARAVADRLARGQDARSVLRSVATVCLGAMGLAGCAIALAWGPVTDRLFQGDDFMTAMLVVGVLLFSLVYVGRGVFGGVRWFRGYAASLCIDGAVRMLMAAPLVFVASERVAAVAVVGAGVIGIGAPIAARARKLRRMLRGAAAPPFPIRAAIAFAAPASIISTVDQMLVNGGPLLVAAGGGRHATTAAGLVFAATMIVRAPVYVFQGLGASLLANLTHLNATADPARLRAAVTRIAAIMLGAGALTTAIAVAVGPAALRLLFGPTYLADRLQLAALGAGVGLYLAASTLSQALLATDRGGRASVAWLGSLGVFLAVYSLTPGAPLSRIGAAFLAAAVANLTLLATAAVHRPLRVATDAG